MKDLETMQVNGPMSSNSGYPKGSIYNPYSTEEFDYMCDHGLWTVGAYVKTFGYVMPMITIVGNSNNAYSNYGYIAPPTEYTNWNLYESMEISINGIINGLNFYSGLLYYGSNGEFYLKNARTNTWFRGGTKARIKVVPISEEPKLRPYVKATQTIGKVTTWGGLLVDVVATIYYSDNIPRDLAGVAGGFGGSYVGSGAGTFVGVNIGAPIGVIFLGECGAPTGSAVGGAIGSAIGTIIGYYTGKNIGTALYDMLQEYLEIINH